MSLLLRLTTPNLPPRSSKSADIVARANRASRLSVNSAFERECVELFSGFLNVWGMPKSVGSIYGLLFSSPVPLCSSDIVEKLGASKGSISQGLAFLRQRGAIRAVELPGDRREFFEPELGLRRLANGLIKKEIQPLMNKTRAAVDLMKRHASVADGGQSRFQNERIRQLEAWHRQLGRILPLFQTMLSISSKC